MNSIQTPTWRSLRSGEVDVLIVLVIVATVAGLALIGFVTDGLFNIPLNRHINRRSAAERERVCEIVLDLHRQQ